MKGTYTNLDLDGLSISQRGSSGGEMAGCGVLGEFHTEHCAQLVN
jgi:hypothetical protein